MKNSSRRRRGPNKEAAKSGRAIWLIPVVTVLAAAVVIALAQNGSDASAQDPASEASTDAPPASEQIDSSQDRDLTVAAFIDACTRYMPILRQSGQPKYAAWVQLGANEIDETCHSIGIGDPATRSSLWKEIDQVAHALASLPGPATTTAVPHTAPPTIPTTTAPA